MSKRSARLAAGVVATMLGLGTSLAAVVPAANAAPAKIVKYSCQVPIIGKQVAATSFILSAPAKAKAGQTVTIKVQIHPTGLPAVAVTNISVSSTLGVSGAQKGSVKVTGHLASGNSGNLKLTLSGKLKLTKAGKVSLSAGKSATFNVTSSLIGKASITCQAASSLPVLGSISVGKSTAHMAPARVREAARLR